MKYPSIFKAPALVLFCMLSASLFGQGQVQNITIYSKVWGFLKYHHPAVAVGTINWDSVFISHITKVRYAGTSLQLNREISLTIDAAGPLKPQQPPELPKEVMKANFELAWLKSSALLSKGNRRRLQQIYNNRNQGNCRFIKFNNASDFSGENQYTNMRLPSTEYRLLFLARFWNVIDYFAPYKYLAGEDWNRVLPRFIPKFIGIGDTLSYYKILLQLAVCLNDGHSQVSIDGDDRPVSTFVFGRYTTPIYSTLIGDTAIVRRIADDSLCKKAGIQNGDIILAVNGEPLNKRIARRMHFVTASDASSKDSHLAMLLFNTPDTTQMLTLKRKNRVFNTKVRCMINSNKNWQYINNYTGNTAGYEMVSKNILRIYASQITSNNLDTLRKMILKSKAVIFDVRNYPGQDDFFNILGVMLPQPEKIDYSTFFMPGNPGIFKWKSSNKIGDVNPKYFKGRTVILVDQRSQSQAEYSAMVLQTIPNSITIGSQTAGADGVVSYIPMAGHVAISYSGYGIYYPDKTPTQRRGVRIDIPVKKTVKNEIENQDVIFGEALKFLHSVGVK